MRNPWLSILAAGLVGAATTSAQSGPPASAGPWFRAVNLGATGQIPASLRAGGDLRLSIWSAEVSALYRADTMLSGLSLSYTSREFDFDDPSRFGGRAPWSRVETLSAGVFVSPPPWRDWRFRLAPSLRLARESGADAGDAWVWGGIVSAQRELSSTLSLGLGGGVFYEVDRIKGFPFIAVDWKINDTFRLANPRPAGPAGPAGLELSWMGASPWTVAAGASYLSERFRLDHRPGDPAAVGLWRGAPAWARLGWRRGPFSANLLAGVIVAGRVRTETRSGGRIEEDRLSPAPFAALTLSAPF
jgi:hypothetical protein